MRWRFLLQPGWLALTAVVFAFAISCYTLLAPWQFDRNAERETQNAAVEHSFSATPQPLSRVLPGGAAPDARTEWQRVVVEGRYLADDEVVARLRTVQGEPAFEVLTPLRTDDGDVVLVDRGYVRPDNRSQVPDYAAAPSGRVRVEARVRSDEPAPRDREILRTRGAPQSYSVSSEVVEQATRLDVRPGYLQLADGQPGVLGALPLPQLDEGPFLSYALQWIAFGTMALLAWLYFTIRELKPGGALAEERPTPGRRKSVAQILAEDEAEERRENAEAR